MSYFYTTERIEKRNDVITYYKIETRCSECNALLKSSDDWSRHRSMHTPINEFTRLCHITQEVAK